MSAAPVDTPAAGSRARRLVALLCLPVLALVLRVAVVVQYEAHHPQAEDPVIDEAAYDSWAVEIAGGDWLGDEIFFQEPLYPYWLASLYALFGHDRTIVRLVQALLGAVTVWLVQDAASRMLSRRAGFVAGLGVALYPELLLLPARLLKENLFVTLFALLAWLLVRSHARPSRASWLGLGVLSGAGALLRGNVLVLLPLLCAWPLLRSGIRRGAWLAGARAGVLVAAGAVLVLLPVALRNLRVGGAFVLTTSGAGTNFYGGNNAENPYGRATEFSWVRGIPRHEADDWRHEAERRLGRELAPDEVSDYWLGETLRSMRADPRMHLGILWNKLRLTLSHHEVPDNHHLGWDARYVALLRAPLPGFELWGSLALGGALLWLLGRRAGVAVRDRAAAGEVLLLAALYLGTIVLTVTSNRVRAGALPLLLPFAGLAVDAVGSCLRPAAGVRSRPLVLGLALALGALFPVWPVLSPADLAEELDTRDLNHAVHLLRRGESLDEARRIAEDIERRRGTARVRTLLAELDFVEAQSVPEREAQQVLLQRALARLQTVASDGRVMARERQRAQHLEGYVLLFLGQGEGAALRLREALAFDPGDPELSFALANALFLAADERAGSEREAALAECETLLSRLADDPGPVSERAVAAALEQVRTAAAAGSAPSRTAPGGL